MGGWVGVLDGPIISPWFIPRGKSVQFWHPATKFRWRPRTDKAMAREITSSRGGKRVVLDASEDGAERLRRMLHGRGGSTRRLHHGTTDGPN